MIDRTVKKALGQMMKGVQVVAATDGDLVRAYTSHWVCQVSFEEPIVLASISPKHDTYKIIDRVGEFTVSILAGDQIAPGQYFSYPGHKFQYSAPEFLSTEAGRPVVPDCIAWFHCEVVSRQQRVGEVDLDHELFFARVVEVGEGRLKEPALCYSSRQGWRVASEPAREPGISIRDQLLARIDPPVIP